MDYNSYFMDGNFNVLNFKNQSEYEQIQESLTSKFGNTGYKVVSWESIYDKDNGLDVTEAENMTLSEAINLANSLVDNNKVISANIWINNKCIYCINWYEGKCND